MASVWVRQRLPWAGFLLLAAYLALFGIAMVGKYGIGWDAHAYYVAWSGGLYEELPETRDAYNYSPLFAQAIWPLTLLPWPVFCAVLLGAAGAGVLWLSRPLPPVLAVGMWLFCLPEILSGNVFWLLAVLTVVGFSRGSPWCVAAFTKVLLCLGPVWFLARQEWRQLAGFVAVSAALLGVSVAISPGEWVDWIDFLRDSAGDSSGNVYLTPLTLTFPLAARLPLALVVAVVAARTDRRWLLPVAMLVASPVVGWGSFALLAAIPRLRAGASSDLDEDRASSDSGTRSLTW
jgi:hypothetical protein